MAEKQKKYYELLKVCWICWNSHQSTTQTYEKGAVGDKLGDILKTLDAIYDSGVAQADDEV